MATALQTLREAFDDGDFCLVAECASEILDALGSESPQEVFRKLDKASTQCEHASLVSGQSYIRGYRSEPSDGYVEDVMQLATKSEDPGVAGPAICELNTWFVKTRPNDRHALKDVQEMLSDVAGAGYPPAYLFMAKNHETGLLEGGRNLSAAMKCYEQAISGGVPEGLLELARMIVENRMMDTGHSVLDLLRKAIEAEVYGAEELLDYVKGKIEKLNESDKEMLPFKVTPAGIKRPEQIRAALLNECNIKREEAELLVANMFGYPDWPRLRNSAEDGRTIKGKFDEDCTEDELSERRSLLITVVHSHLDDLAAYIVEGIVDLLMPLSREGIPSLRGLQAKSTERVVEAGIGIIDKLFDELEITSDGLRASAPVRPDVWLKYLAKYFGWKFQAIEQGEALEGSRVATALTRKDDVFEVFMSSISHLPGDTTDDHVEKLEQSIANQSSNAVILFNRPTFSFENETAGIGILYGGRILNRGEWSDFVLKPSGGLDEALGQKGGIRDGVPNPDFKKALAFGGVRELASTMLAEVMGERPGEIRLEMLQTGDWCFLVSADLNEVVRTLMGVEPPRPR